LLLVQLARAGTKRLREYFELKIRTSQNQRLQIKNRVVAPMSLSLEARAIYYSDWIYAAVHVLISLSEFQSREALSKKLGLTIQRTAEVLDFLIRVGLVQKKENRFSVGQKRLHLRGDSPFVIAHHTNWRLQALQSLATDREKGLHYSSIVSLSEEDLNVCRSLFVAMIESFNSRVEKSKDETAAVLTLDFFRF